MSIKKLLFRAVVVSAVAFGIISCVGGGTAVRKTDDDLPAMSIDDRLRAKAIRENPGFFVGVGRGTSTNASMAGNISQANAQRELAGQIQTSVQSALNDAMQQSAVTEEAMGGVQRQVITRIDESLKGARIIDTRTVNEGGKVTVYSVIILSEKPIEEALANTRELQEFATTAVMMDQIRKSLNQLNQ